MRCAILVVGLPFVWLAASGCGPGVAGDDHAIDTTTDTPSDVGDDALPAACVAEQSPFVQGECLGGLADACSSLTAEAVCTGAALFEFDGYGVRCRWVAVVTISDPAACTVESVTHRCEAALDQLDGACAPCSAIPSEGEIIAMCNGPLGPWSAVGSDSDHVGACAPNTSPPAPALCACAPAECAVE